jgi:hypothetical protein
MLVTHKCGWGLGHAVNLERDRLGGKYRQDLGVVLRSLCLVPKISLSILTLIWSIKMD